MALALLYLSTFTDGTETRTWKGFSWEVLDRLFEKGYIGNPKTKAKSRPLTEVGEQLSKALFFKHFSREDK